jgi:hypothetical protein
MHKKHRAVILSLLVMSLAIFGCGLGGIIGPTPTAPAPTNTPLPPTAAATATNTPIPATPTVAPIPGSKEPLLIGGMNLSISTVVLSDEGYNGMAPYPMTDDQTVLAVEVILISGELETLSQLGVWVMDEAGNRTDPGTTLSAEDKHQVVWMFPVAKTAQSFLLYFPGGEVIDLAPLLP